MILKKLGVTTIPFITMILARPVVIRNPSSQTINISDTVTISCQINGIPNPTVTWLKGNRTIDISKYTTTSIGISELSNLTLTNVTIADSGKYRCKGENVADRIYSSEADLIIHCKLCHNSNIYSYMSFHSLKL